MPQARPEPGGEVCLVSEGAGAPPGAARHLLSSSFHLASVAPWPFVLAAAVILLSQDYFSSDLRGMLGLDQISKLRTCWLLSCCFAVTQRGHAALRWVSASWFCAPWLAGVGVGKVVTLLHMVSDTARLTP